MTLAADANAHAAAAGNWRWLTGLGRTDDALHAGDPADPLPAILALQFARTVSLDHARADTPAALSALPDGSFDYAVFPGILGWWKSGTSVLCRTANRLLREEGWVAMSGSRDRRAGALADALRQSGFTTVRRYALSPSADRPFMVIPRTRIAALACERDLQRQRGGHRARVVLAALGLHDLLYRGWLILARR